MVVSIMPSSMVCIASARKLLKAREAAVLGLEYEDLEVIDFRL